MANMRQTISQALNFALVLSTAFMMWKGLSVASASSSPIVVVLSGSMEPAFQRGDLLFLWNRSPRTEVGEIVVYNVRGKDIPIVHRVVRSYPEVEGKAKTVKEITVYVLDASNTLRSSHACALGSGLATNEKKQRLGTKLPHAFDQGMSHSNLSYHGTNSRIRLLLFRETTIWRTTQSCMLVVRIISTVTRISWAVCAATFRWLDT